jgi:hypothetical protein
MLLTSAPLLKSLSLKHEPTDAAAALTTISNPELYLKLVDAHFHVGGHLGYVVMKTGDDAPI